MFTHSFVFDFVNHRLKQLVGGGVFNLSYNETLYNNALVEFKFDYNRWFPNDLYIDEKKVLLTPQLVVLLMYRLAREYFLLPEDCTYKNDADLYALVGRDFGQMEIFYSSRIGRGLKINHGCGSVIGARSIIGDNCLIHQNCTLGDKEGGRPTLGNNVIMYAGSMVLGDITIGDNTIIGANAVVLDSFPNNSILVGSPARNVSI